MTLIMVIKITFKIKIMKVNSVIGYMKIITFNDYNHNNSR